MYYQDLTGRGCWLFTFHARPVSFRYTSHVTTMFTYQTPTRHTTLGVQQDGLAVASIARDDPSTLPGDDPSPRARMHRDHNAR